MLCICLKFALELKVGLSNLLVQFKLLDVYMDRKVLAVAEKENIKDAEKNVLKYFKKDKRESVNNIQHVVGLIAYSFFLCVSRCFVCVHRSVRQLLPVSSEGLHYEHHSAPSAPPAHAAGWESAAPQSLGRTALVVELCVPDQPCTCKMWERVQKEMGGKVTQRKLGF